ncbi:MAG: glucan biosynthesis protein G [Burkholderiaceae bacterium]|nr:glucan biosynthesis protein G [Burkholderiaceae bacterium]
MRTHVLRRRPGARRLPCAALLLLLCLAPTARAFGLDDVAPQAQALARAGYQPPPPPDPALAALSYDDYRRIRFKPERALWHGSGAPFEVQFFPLGRGFTRPLKLYEVDGDTVRPLVIPGADFNDEGVLPPARARAADAGAAGWRLKYPLNDPKVFDEVVVFLGASYFRAVGAGQHYGLSARALAVDTVGGRGEEFPAFTTFWLQRPLPGARSFTFYALLDGPSASGAYRFVLHPGEVTTLDVSARLYSRKAVATLGLAPLTSMFLAGENQPAADDYRPEVHDSDGLLVQTGDGERIWRPLINPAHPFVTSFAMSRLGGFGLMQRDRAFRSYEDLEAHYQSRPGAWVEPRGDWGAGRVELLQFHTPDETNDNIVAYWVPKQAPAPGTPLALDYRVHWALAGVPPAAGATVLQTRRGHGYREGAVPPNELQFQIDFAGRALQGLAPGAVIDVVASGNDNVRKLRAHAYPNPQTGGWRVSLAFERIDAARPVELRAQLRDAAGAILSETWSYALAPE